MMEVSEIESIREEVIKVLVETGNIDLLKRTLRLIREDFQSGESVGFRVNGTSITRKDLEDSITESQQQIERGEFVTIEELEEESKLWL